MKISPIKLFLVFLNFLLLSVIYKDTILEIANICLNDDDYSHGILLPFISLFLLWDRKNEYRIDSNNSFFLPTILLFFGLLLFTLGYSSQLSFLCWVSFFPVIISYIYLIWGKSVCLTTLGPILLLFMSKPLPDSVVVRIFWPLQVLAAKIGAFTLEKLKVPVYLSGNVIEIPTMRLMVEEACSGMRSVMALITIAFTIMLLKPLNVLGKIILVLIALFLAVSLNVFRVALTGVLAHFYDPKAATGFFHTFSGFLVFLIGLPALFFISSLIEKYFVKNKSYEKNNNILNNKIYFSDIFRKINYNKLFIILFFVSCTYYVNFQYLLSRVKNESSSIDLKNLPYQIGPWKGEDSIGLDLRSLDILKLSSYARRKYTLSTGESIYLYIGYWAHQTGEYQAAKHSPALCLPSNGWITENLENYNYNDTELGIIPIRRIEGEKRRDKELFYYWFFSGNSFYSKEWYALLELAVQSFVSGRNDGGIIEVHAEMKSQSEESKVKTDLIIQDFISHLFPLVKQNMVTIKKNID